MGLGRLPGVAWPVEVVEVEVGEPPGVEPGVEDPGITASAMAAAAAVSATVAGTTLLLRGVGTPGVLWLTCVSRVSRAASSGGVAAAGSGLISLMAYPRYPSAWSRPGVLTVRACAVGFVYSCGTLVVRAALAQSARAIHS